MKKKSSKKILQVKVKEDEFSKMTFEHLDFIKNNFINIFEFEATDEFDEDKYWEEIIPSEEGPLLSQIKFHYLNKLRDIKINKIVE